MNVLSIYFDQRFAYFYHTEGKEKSLMPDRKDHLPNVQMAFMDEDLLVIAFLRWQATIMRAGSDTALSLGIFPFLVISNMMDRVQHGCAG